MKGSKIFQQNRALGYVSNAIPAAVRYIVKRKENLVVTVVGRSFQTYGCEHFRLICVSGLHPENITALTSDPYMVFTAAGKTIYGWRGGSVILHTYTGHTTPVHLLLTFGNHLISVDEGSVMKIWGIKSEEVFLEIPFDNDQFKVSALLHPATYVNKLLVGSEQGDLQLWNIKKAKLLFSFQNLGSKVTTLEQPPAVDTVAVGLQSGRIVLLNLKFDEIIMEFTQDWGPVTALTFRTDGQPIMVSASTNGQVVFWNLEEKKIVSSQLAHNDSVTTLKCLPSEPLLLTTSPDNSMKMWIFDMPDGGVRILRNREGHSAPPLCIRYHGANGQNVLSAGEDSSMKIFSTLSETLNRNMGTASYNKKAAKRSKFETERLRMPPIVAFTTETTREKEWDNVAAIHSGLTAVTTWSYAKCKKGDLRLQPKDPKIKTATCMALTHCGNFVVIGYMTGEVIKFNIQSGLERGNYGTPAHKAAVRGVEVDNLNQFVITGASDGKVKFWSFKAKALVKTINLREGVTRFHSHRESSMVCVALEDFSLNILDGDTKVVVRRFVGHTAEVTDTCFSPDSRWLVSSSMDCTIKVWDIPSAYLVDNFRVANACISLSMSPTGDFLATAHVDYLGIYLWANKSLFNHISLRALAPDAEPFTIDLPTTAMDVYGLDDKMATVVLEDDGEGELIDAAYATPEQLADDLVTMSTAAASRWQNLLNLDTVKKRNKPKAAPTKPKQAPFFLPTVSGLDFKFDVAGTTATDDGSQKLLRPSTLENFTKFGRLLKATVKNDDFEAPIAHLLALGPSAIDFEIKSLAPIGGGSLEIMQQFVKLVIHMLQTNRHFELAQSYLGVFLQTHDRVIVENPELRDYLDEVEAAQLKGWKCLEEEFLYGIGVVSNLRNFVA